MAIFGTSNLETEIDINEQQQEFFHLFGHDSSIVYDCYPTKESLMLKINLIVPNLNEDQRNTLITTLWNQNEYTGGKCLFMSPIFVTLVLDHNACTQPELKILSKNFEVHPVFRVQKCSAKLSGENNSKCCAVFVDETGRVYMDWTQFQIDNQYNDGLVVAPFNGIYTGSPDGKGKLELFERKAGITKSLDRGSTVIGLASASIAIVTAFVPAITIAAPIVAVTAAVAGLTCAVYTGLRGVYNLYDRKSHKQTINLTNREARSSWLSVASGAFSASAASATQLIATTARSGSNVSHITRSTVHALSAGAIGLHTTDCLDNIQTMIVRMYENEHITTLEVSQLSELLFLLTHSVKNHRMAENMLTLSKSYELAEFKKILSESQKLGLKALVHETMVVKGLTNEIGQIIVRSLKNKIDPQPILMELSDEEHQSHSDDVAEKEATNESEAKSTKENESSKKKQETGNGEISGTVVKSIKRNECSEMLEKRIASFVTHILSSFKSRGENELKLFAINIMKELSLHSFDIFMNLVETFIDKYGTMIEARSKNVITFEHIAIMILKQLKVISQDSNEKDLKEYLINLTETERCKIDERISQYFEHLQEEHIQHAEELLASHVDLSDDEKLSIVLDGEVDDLIEKFQTIGIVNTLDDLRETIKDILVSMSLSASHVFFAIANKFLSNNGSKIQHRLGRFISTDIFLANIYQLLRRFSMDCGQELESYLLDYNDELFQRIEKDICEFYDNQMAIGQSIQCQKCSGSHYN